MVWDTKTIVEILTIAMVFGTVFKLYFNLKRNIANTNHALKDKPDKENISKKITVIDNSLMDLANKTTNISNTLNDTMKKLEEHIKEINGKIDNLRHEHQQIRELLTGLYNQHKSNHGQDIKTLR